MGKPKYKAETFFYFIIGIMYVFVISYIAVTAGNLNISLSTILTFCLISVAANFLIFYNKYVISFLILAATVLGTAFLVYLERQNFESDIFYQMYDYFNELNLFINGYLPYTEKFNNTILFLASFGSGAFFAFNTRLRFGFFSLAFLGFSAFMIPAFLEIETGYLPLVIFSFCFAALLAKYLNFSANKQKIDFNFANRRVSFAALFISLLVILAAVFIPRPKYDRLVYVERQNKLLDRYTGTESSIETAFLPEYFNFRTTGFSGEDTKLGGEVTPNKRFVMEVFADERVYLAGAKKDTYTGDMWTVDQIYSTEMIKDADGSYDISGDNFFTQNMSLSDRAQGKRPSPVNMILPVSLYAETEDGENSENSEAGIDNKEISIELIKKELTVNIWENRTKSIFIPEGATGLLMSDETEVFRENEDLHTEEFMPNYYTYTMKYISNFYQNENFPDIARGFSNNMYSKSNDKYSYEIKKPDMGTTDYSGVVILSDGTIHYIYGDEPQIERNLDGTVLTPRDDGTFDSYNPNLALPEDLPQRVIDLAKEITADCKYDYDKAKAIEEYLRKFPYTLKPEPVPKDADFVDYFLFEGQEGYCTYFASAFAVMCRAVGIPSRYVEGFSMPSAKNANNGYSITNQQAHAWPEVFLKTVGWTQFEPTPPYSYSFYDEEMPPAESIFSESMMESEEFEEHKKDLGLEEETPKLLDGRVENQNEENQSENIEENEAEEAKTSSPWVKFLKFLLLMILAVILFLIILVLGMLLDKNRFRKIDNLPLNESVIKYYKYIINIISLVGYPKKENETATQFAERVEPEFTKSEFSLKSLAEIFDKAMYSGKNISGEEQVTIRSAYFDLLEKLQKEEMSRLEFSVYKYILCRF